MKLPGRRTGWAIAAAAAGLFILPYVSQNPYVLNITILMLLNIVLGMSWNVIGGFGGQHSFGHTAFFGLGAYATMLVYQNAGGSPWLGMGLGVVLSMLLAVVIGALCFRLRGAYFSLATIASAEVLRIVITSERGITGGAEGVLLPPDKVPTIFGTPLDQIPRFIGLSPSPKIAFLYMLLVLSVITFFICRYILSSRMGYYLNAIREDQDAAEALGINSAAWKLGGLMISAGLTAVAGSLFALYLRFVDPDTVLSLPRSVDMVLICILGGIGTLYGPIVGGVLVTLVLETFRMSLGAASLLVYGILVVAIILFMPRGITEGLKRRIRPQAVSP